MGEILPDYTAPLFAVTAGRISNSVQFYFLYRHETLSLEILEGYRG
jgi:hypothetical protein